MLKHLKDASAALERRRQAMADGVTRHLDEAAKIGQDGPSEKGSEDGND